jgi:hypothetical protein
MVLPFFKLLAICTVFSLYRKQIENKNNRKLSWFNLHAELDRTTAQCFLNWNTSVSSHRFIAVGLPHGSLLPKSKLFSWVTNSAYGSARRQNPGEHHHRPHRRENLKFHNSLNVYNNDDTEVKHVFLRVEFTVTSVVIAYKTDTLYILVLKLILLVFTAFAGQKFLEKKEYFIISYV